MGECCIADSRGKVDFKCASRLILDAVNVRLALGWLTYHMQKLRLSPELVVLTQDVFHLLASSRLVRWLRTDDGDGYGQALNAWLAPLAIQKEMLPGVYTGRAGDLFAVAVRFLALPPVSMLPLRTGWLPIGCISATSCGACRSAPPQRRGHEWSPGIDVGMGPN